MTGPTREEVRRQRREQIEARQQDSQRAAQRQAMRKRLMVWGSVGAVVLVIGLGLWWAVREATAPSPGEAVPIEGQAHVEVGTPITYQTYPPASGTHFPATARWEFYDAPVQPGFWIHNLEHGGIVILYKCPEDCAELKGRLKFLYDKFPRSKYGYPKLVIAADTQIQGRVTILAWGKRLALDEFDEEQLRRFYQAFVDRGPEDAG